MITRLDWDSEFFGFEIGEVLPTELLPERLPVEALAGGYRCVYYRCDAGDGEALRKAARAELALVDIRVTLEIAIGDRAAGGVLAPAPGVAIGLFQEADRAALGRIAEQLSVNSRFAFDPGFGPERARQLYAEWLRVSCEGRADAILVARRAGEPVGFVTCRCSSEQARLELVAVDSAHAGRGVGTSLLAEANAWLAARGMRLVRVATQGRNPAAINFYSRCGFRIRDVALVHHRWF